MKILSRTCAIETDLDTESRYAAMTVHPCVNGFGVGMAMLCGEFYLCRKNGGMFIVAIPSERWLQDMKDDGFEIVESLTRNPVPDPDNKNNFPV